MARIRHIAIGTQNPAATARFYIEGLGLKEVGRVNSSTAEGYYLSDGHVNLAILKILEHPDSRGPSARAALVGPMQQDRG